MWYFAAWLPHDNPTPWCSTRTGERRRRFSDPSARDQFTVGFGPRLHFKVGESSWIRPGISYSRALDDPMAKKDYNILQIDLLFAF